jgi:DNA-binding NarL/FixJ family response regulator
MTPARLTRKESNGRPPISCVIADDHPAVLESISRFLTEQGIHVTSCAPDGLQALEAIEETQPTLALVDIRMPRLGGIEIIRQSARSAPDTAIVIYTGGADPGQLADALDAGARGFVLKGAPLADLLRALETVAGGGVYVDPALGRSLFTPEREEALTGREREVLRLLSEGLRNEEIGKAIFISAETVRSDAAKAMRKLGAKTRTEAVATALRRSLIG